MVALLRLNLKLFYTNRSVLALASLSFTPPIKMCLLQSKLRQKIGMINDQIRSNVRCMMLWRLLKKLAIVPWFWKDWTSGILKPSQKPICLTIKWPIFIRFYWKILFVFTSLPFVWSFNEDKLEKDSNIDSSWLDSFFCGGWFLTSLTVSLTDSNNKN